MEHAATHDQTRHTRATARFGARAREAPSDRRGHVTHAPSSATKPVL